MKIYPLNSEGINFTFHVQKDSTKPCSHCGVPACGKEDFLWYEEDKKRITLIYDGSTLDLAIGDFVDEKKHDMPYQQLPNFIRECNEVRGWADADDFNGYILDIDDFLVSLQLLLTYAKLGKWISTEELLDMKKLATEAKSKNCLLKIARS